MPVCTKPDRSGQAVQHHRLARCDGGSALCAGEALILPYKCTAGEQAPAHLANTDPDSLRIHRAPWEVSSSDDDKNNLLEPVFKDGKRLRLEKFDEIRNKVDAALAKRAKGVQPAA